jgi:hypothetical protein
VGGTRVTSLIILYRRLVARLTLIGVM